MPRGPVGRVLVIVACVSVMASSAAARQATPPDPLVKANATIKVAAHTYVIPDGNIPLVPNVGIIVGSRATLVIDPGLGRRNGETVLREVARVSRNAEVFIASTHFHAEHTTGYLAFPATATYVNSVAQEAEFAEGIAPQIKAFSARSPMIAGLLQGATGRKADVTFDRDYVLDLGGVRVRFLVVGPTHTRADTALFVEEDGVLFSGDVVMNNSFLAATPVTSMRAWLAAFDTLEALRPRTIVPSHGEVGDGSIIGPNRAIMRGVQTRVQALKAQGRTADEAATMVQMEYQEMHPGWPRANGLVAAARAAYAEAPSTSSLGHSIQGRWELVAAEDLRADGSVGRYPWGMHPTGSIVVEGGWCYLQIMSSNVPTFDGGASPGEQMKAALLSTYIAYTGPCTVDEPEGRVTLKVEAAWRPDYVGTEQTRFFRFDDGRLIFGPARNSVRAGSESLTRRLTLVRP